MSKLLRVQYEGSFKKNKNKKVHFFYHNDCLQGCLKKSINRGKKKTKYQTEKRN